MRFKRYRAHTCIQAKILHTTFQIKNIGESLPDEELYVNFVTTIKKNKEMLNLDNFYKARYVLSRTIRKTELVRAIITKTPPTS